MAQQVINVGAAPNDRTGDTWRDAMIKVNDNTTELYTKFSDSIVFVNEESDLPNIVGDVSTLAANTLYYFASGIILDVRLVVDEGTALAGVGPFADPGITYNGIGSFITATDVGFQIYNLSIDAPNCAQLFDCKGTPGVVNAFYGNGFRGRQCPKIGTFDSYTPTWNNFVFLDVGDGISFANGPVIGGSFVNGFMTDTSGASVMFDFADAVFLDFEINKVIMDGTGTALSSSIAGANMLGNEAEIRDNTFGLSGTMTILSGFDEYTNGWNFQGNSPTTQIADTKQLGEAYLTTANTIVVSAASTFYEIGVPGSGAWAEDITDRFSMGTDGVLTYTGTKPIEADINIQASIEKVGGGNNELEVRAAINWTAADPGIEKSRAITQNSTPTSVFCRAVVDIQPNDTIRPIFANNSGTSNIIVNTVRYDVKGG